MATTSADSKESSLANLKETYAADNAELEKSLIASKETLVDAERRIKELEHIRDTLNGLEN